MTIKKLLALAFFAIFPIANLLAQRTFVHPGGLHTESDFQRMRENMDVSPWKESWQLILADPYSQSTRGNEANYTNIGGSGNRQAAARDAYAAYLNTLRWRVAGTTANADCAVRIMNAWANKCTEASGELFQLPIYSFVQAAEMLRGYSGWANADQEKFKTLVRDVFLPACNDFWTNCTHASWAAPAASSMMIMGIYLDSVEIYNKALAYFKGGDEWAAIGEPGHGYNFGSVTAVVDSLTGQIGEMGRDQPHAAIGPAALAEMCQIAWNQGDDLYSFDNNLLLKGYEYYCKYNLNNEVPWTTFYWCGSDDGYTWFYPSQSYRNRTNSSPVYEMLYNHYVVLEGLDAPWLTKMTNLSRPEEGQQEVMGYGTFCYTLDAGKSPQPGCPVPGEPTDLKVCRGLGSVMLSWKKPEDDVARGYEIFRSTTGKSYSKIYSWDRNTSTTYEDTTVDPKTTYYYKVKATNTAGESDFSNVDSLTTGVVGKTLPLGWGFADVGSVATAGKYTHELGTGSFRIIGSGTDIGGSSDSHAYIYTKVKGDMSFSARLSNIDWGNSGGYRKIGLLLRESLNANSKRVSMTLGDGWNRHTRMAYRTSTGGTTNYYNGNDFTAQPIWFKLDRKGNLFSAYQSVDSINWYCVGSDTIDMSENYYVGLASCANDANGETLAGTFDFVKIEGGDTDRPSAPKNFTAVSQSSSSIALSWTADSAASTYILSRSESQSGPYKVIGEGLPLTSFTDQNLEFYKTYYYALVSQNRSGLSADTSYTSARTDTIALPSAPAGLTKAFNNSYVMLKWNPTGEFTQYYNVKRAQKLAGDYEIIAQPDTTFFVDQHVKNNTRYYYMVSAVNSVGESRNSVKVTGTPEVDDSYYWPLNEENSPFIDVWNNQEATGNSLTSSVTGKFGSCVQMNGNSSYLKMPDDLLTGLSSYTLSFWMYLNSNKLWTRVFNFGNDVNNSMYITTWDENGYLRYSIKVNGSTEQHIRTTFKVQTGQWYHVVLKQSNALGILYINGSEVGRNSTFTYNANSLGETAANYFGRPLSSDPYFNGKIDEIRIYRSAIDDGLIQYLAGMKDQKLTFDELPHAVAGGNDIVAHITSSLDMPITLTSTNDSLATVSQDSLIHPLAVGTVNLVASQLGSIGVAAAVPVTNSLVIAVSDDIHSVQLSDVHLTNDLSGHIYVTSLSTVISAALYSNSGLLIDQQEGKDLSFDLSHHPGGVYLLNVKQGNQHVVYKVIRK